MQLLAVDERAAAHMRRFVASLTRSPACVVASASLAAGTALSVHNSSNSYCASIDVDEATAKGLQQKLEAALQPALWRELVERQVVKRRGAAFFTASDGTRLHYTDQAKTTANRGTVLLIHGTGMSGFMWQAPGWGDAAGQLEAAGFRPITIDLRGAGDSDKYPHQPARFGWLVMQDVLELMDHLGIGHAHLVGFSLGGRLMGPLLAQHPERWHSATLVGSELRREADDLVAVQTKIHGILDAIAPYYTSEELGSMHAQSTPANLKAQVVSDAQMARLTTPTLAIVGTADTSFDLVHRRLPGAPPMHGHGTPLPPPPHPSGPVSALLETQSSTMTAIERVAVFDRTGHVFIPTHAHFVEELIAFMRAHDPSSSGVDSRQTALHQS